MIEVGGHEMDQIQKAKSMFKDFFPKNVLKFKDLERSQLQKLRAF